MLYACDRHLVFEREGEILWLESYGPGIIRVRGSASGHIEPEDWTLMPPEESCADISINGGGTLAEIKSGSLSAKIDFKGDITFYSVNDKQLLRNAAKFEQDVPARGYRCVRGDLFKIEAVFEPNEGEHFYGLGQEGHDRFDLKGSVIDLCQKNTKSTIPFLISTRGYGFLWNNPAIGRAELSSNHTRWVAEAAVQLDYIVIEGTVPEIVKRYTGITGRAPALPYWATGLWQSKLRYETKEELMEAAREYKRRGLPLSMIVADYFHWPQQGEWKFDGRFWPDPGAMVRELDEMGIRLLVSIWPTVDPRSENYPYMKEHNMLVRSERGPGTLMYCRGPETYYDATHPRARAFVFDKCKQNYYKYGIRNFWLDESEPEITPYDYDNLRYHLGNGMQVSSLYPYYYAKGFYDGLREAGEEEVVNLIRCAWVGIQRFGVVLWSGDITSDFDSLRKQIKAGLHVSLCGIPWWTTDIGGFHGGDPNDPEYRELFVRWYQFGAFCPIFRMHGFRFRADRPEISPWAMDGWCPKGGPNEIWSFGGEAYAIMKKYLFIREALRPYIWEQMKLAHEDGTPVMRPLFYDFNDEVLAETGDEYMFGPELLAAPVIEKGADKRRVYLPAGTEWIYAPTGETMTGGRFADVPAPLDTIPVFVRKGLRSDGLLRLMTIT